MKRKRYLFLGNYTSSFQVLTVSYILLVSLLKTEVEETSPSSLGKRKTTGNPLHLLTPLLPFDDDYDENNNNHLLFFLVERGNKESITVIKAGKEEQIIANDSLRNKNRRRKTFREAFKQFL
jgi:hypothetical protein